MRYEILALFPFCVCTKFVHVVNVPVNYRWVPRKGKAATVPKLQVENLAAQFLEKGQSKNSGETSNLLIFDLPSFFLQLGNFLLSSPGLFFLSRHSRLLSSIYRQITSSYPGLSRGKSVFLQELPPDP
jgi:hypothetical protein